MSNFKAGIEVGLTDSSNPEFQALCQEFVRSCEGRADRLERSLADIPDPEAIAAAHTVAHNLAGVAATFGFDDLQSKSERLEELLMAEHLDEPRIRSEVSELIYLLRRTASR